MSQNTHLHCACGQVHLEVERMPIMSVECYCNSCRQAGARLHELSPDHLIVSENGGTRFVLYRKDRVRLVSGADHLKEFRLTADSPTRRVIATCCNMPVFLEFQNGHWLSLYGHLWPQGTLPPLQLRTMTSDLPDPSVLSDDVPNAGHQTPAFFMKLLVAWAAMGFRTPTLTYVNGEVRA